MITYHQVVQRSPEWFELRKGLWTGSIAIKLLQGKPMPPESDFTGNYYTKRKQAESKEQHERLKYREQYNEKPNNWQRSDDYAWSKLQDERRARDERIIQAKNRMNNQSEQSASRKEELNRLMQKSQSGTAILNEYFAEEQQKINNLNNLRISNQNGGVLGLLEQYLHGLNTDSQRIEECHNIIKYCKNMARELQVIKEESTSKTIDY